MQFSTWAVEPDVLTPACLSHSAEVVYSELGTKGHRTFGLRMCVFVLMCSVLGGGREQRKQQRMPGDGLPKTEHQ